MAKKKKRRRKKHPGTQAGTRRATPRGRPRSRAEAKARSKRTKQVRADRPPSWKSAALRAGVAAGLFFAVVSVIGEKPLQAFVLAVLAFGFYLPIGYWTDRFMYRRNLRRKAQQAESEEKE